MKGFSRGQWFASLQSSRKDRSILEWSVQLQSSDGDFRYELLLIVSKSALDWHRPMLNINAVCQLMEEKLPFTRSKNNCWPSYQ